MILNGDNIADANFWHVSVGYAVISFVCLYSVFFILYAGIRRVKHLESEAASLETQSEDTKDNRSDQSLES